ncbi:MAG TPA: EH signature domain-containing protein, partial [Candidatus Hodarchaeales archaeon]|nr:EH signature domain-containing protein [Candidatus Hodarchaeales archaeon]
GIILNHRLLGDPRRYRSKWLGVDEIAVQRFISWLSKLDIVFFFDNVLQGRDRQGRRKFWLQYVEKMTSSRPFLSEMTARQFAHVRDVNFGKLTGGANQAAFILHFGEIVVVEFSDVGKIYIYKRNEFEKKIPDMWTMRHMIEYDLKDRRLPEERKIRHQPLNRIVNVDWREQTTSILAREGIRP